MNVLMSSREKLSGCGRRPLAAKEYHFCPARGLIISLCIEAACFTGLPIHAFASDPPAKAETAKVESPTPAFQDEPAARELYRRMARAMQDAESLSYTSDYKRRIAGEVDADSTTACTYRVWLKRPNYFRMEAQSASGDERGILIGDGSALWIYWPTGRPRWKYVTESEADDSTRYTSYMVKPAPPGKVSLWHEAVFLGAGMTFPVVEPSVFFGYVDPIEEHVDAVRSLGTEAIHGEECHKIEVSLMDRQRSWYLWLSRQDGLPRKMKEIVRVGYDVVVDEKWDKVIINGDIPDSLFAWKPPPGWKEWRLPDDEARLLKPGTKAPEIALKSVTGERIRLSEYRGKSVWLYFWRVGCPPCRKQMPELERLYAKYSHQGLVVIGVNVSDDRQIAEAYLHKQGITFPNILDTSTDAERVCHQEYGAGAVPTNYLIDGEGAVVSGWIGYRQGRLNAELALLNMHSERLKKAVFQEWKANVMKSVAGVIDVIMRSQGTTRPATTSDR
jgi:peroxiredoxin/outer membrane lipoprotein-sorting protein